MSDVATWRYHLPNESGEGWAICFLDSIGCFTVLSDYGNYGYRWPQAEWGSGDFREFLAKCDGDYVLHKIATTDEYDPEGTLRAVKERILRERRQLYYNRERAREEWDLLERFERMDSRENCARWYDKTRIDEAYECVRSRCNPRAVAFIKHVLPRLQRRLREELSAAA